MINAVDRLPQAGEYGKRGTDLKHQLQARRIEHKQYIDLHGEDLPEIRIWRWTGSE